MHLREAGEIQGKHIIFVTGSTGVVGFHLIRSVVHAGNEVVAMVRSCSDTHALDELVKTGPFKIRFVTCDLPGAKNLVESMHGCDVVVHTAGCVDPHGFPAIYGRSTSKVRKWSWTLPRPRVFSNLFTLAVSQ